MFLSSIIYLILYCECFFVHCLPFYGSFSLLFPDFSHSFRRFALFFSGSSDTTQPLSTTSQLNQYNTQLNQYNDSYCTYPCTRLPVSSAVTRRSVSDCSYSKSRQVGSFLMTEFVCLSLSAID